LLAATLCQDKVWQPQFIRHVFGFSYTLLFIWRNCHRFDFAKVDFQFITHTLLIFLLARLCLGIKRSLNPEILRNGENNAQKRAQHQDKQCKKNKQPNKSDDPNHGQKKASFQLHTSGSNSSRRSNYPPTHSRTTSCQSSSQEQLAAEPLSMAGSQQQNDDDLPPIHSPTRDNYFPEDETYTELGTCSMAYSCILYKL
jgi:hypothetical protein